MERGNYRIGEVLDRGVEDFTLICGAYDYLINLRLLCNYIDKDDEVTNSELTDLCNCEGETFTLENYNFLCAHFPIMMDLLVSGHTTVTAHSASQLKAIVQYFNMHPSFVGDLITECDRIEKESPADKTHFIQEDSDELEKMDTIIQNKSRQIENLLLIARRANEVGPLRQEVARLKQELSLANTALSATEQNLSDTETMNSNSISDLLKLIKKYKTHFFGLEENIKVLVADRERLQETCNQLTDKLEAAQASAMVYDKTAMEKELANLSLHRFNSVGNFKSPIPIHSKIGFKLPADSPVVYLAGISLGHNKSAPRIASVELYEGEMEPRKLKVFVLNYFQIFVLGAEKLNADVPYHVAVTFETKTPNRATSWLAYELKTPIKVNAITLDPIGDKSSPQNSVIGGFWIKTEL